MHRNGIALGLGLLFSLSGCMHPRAIVLSPTAPEGVRVNGLGKASAPPDIARANLGVEVRAATADAASEEAGKRMAAVLVTLKQLGIAEKDLRTSNYSVAFEQEPNQPAPPQPSAAPAEANTPKAPRGVYRVSNSVTATIRDLKSIGRVIRAATDAGANDFWGLTFDLEDDSALVSRARQLAVIDAKHAAEELAKLTGVTLGEIVSISEGEPTPTEGVNTYALRPAAVEPEVPVEHGQVTVSYPVQIVYTTAR